MTEHGEPPNDVDPIGEGRPHQVFDPMLQHERTALAWERTAIATMVAGVLLARYASEIHVTMAVVGVLQVVTGAVLLLWTGIHYEELHGPLRRGENPARRSVAVAVGAGTVLFTGVALVAGVAVTWT